MRIGFFLGAFPSTSETFVLNQIAGVVEAGHEVEIHAYHVKGHMQHPLLRRHRLLERVFYRPAFPAGKLWRLFKFLWLLLALLLFDSRRTLALINHCSGLPLREKMELFFLACSLRGGRQYNVIHAHFGPNGLMALRLRQAGFLDGAIVTSFHGHDANVVPKQLGEDYYKTLFEEGEAFVVSSNFIRDKLLTLGVRKEKLHRIPVGIDLAQWPFQQRQGWQHEYPVVLSVGRFVEVKGFRYAIEAMALVRKRFPDVQYQLIGDGPDRNLFDQLVKALGMKKSVIFPGLKNQEELADAYRQADLFVMPSVRASDGAEEGQGMVLLEAQASGLPVVATKSGGIPESVPEGMALVAERDINGLASMIVDTLQRVQQGGVDGEAGYRHVRQHFEIGALNRALLELYERLA